MTDWPLWQPGNELKADDLYGLEGYLLARPRIDADLAHGVAHMDLSHGLRVDAEANAVTVRDLRGTTPHGQPVLLLDDDELTCAFDRAHDDDWCFDAAVAVNAQGADAKLTLTVDDIEQTSPLPGVAGDRLFLGRFVCTYDGRLECIARPRVLRLASVRPLNEPWRQWVTPVTKLLQGFFGQLDTLHALNTPGSAAAVATLHQLAFDWPHRPVAELAKQIKLIEWLLKHSENRRAAISASEAPPMPFIELPDASGHLIPQRLADLFGEAVSAPSSKRPLRSGVDFDLTRDADSFTLTLLHDLPPGDLQLQVTPEGERICYLELTDPSGRPKKMPTLKGRHENGTTLYQYSVGDGQAVTGDRLRYLPVAEGAEIEIWLTPAGE